MMKITLTHPKLYRYITPSIFNLEESKNILFCYVPLLLFILQNICLSLDFSIWMKA